MFNYQKRNNGSQGGRLLNYENYTNDFKTLFSQNKILIITPSLTF